MSSPSYPSAESTRVQVKLDTASLQSLDSKTKLAKNRLTFFSQILIVYIIIITSLVQICLHSPDKELWLILLSSSIGYILPSPGLKFRKSTFPSQTITGFDEPDSKTKP